jgi:hypothetical protein
MLPHVRKLARRLRPNPRLTEADTAHVLDALRRATELLEDTMPENCSPYWFEEREYACTVDASCASMTLIIRQIGRCADADTQIEARAGL